MPRPIASLTTCLAAGAACMALAGPAAAAPGQLAFDGCFASSAQPGCETVPPAALDGASGVAASADGKSVYVASARFPGAIATFSPVGSGGRMLFDGCLTNDFFGEDCTHVPKMDLRPANGVAASPNGKRVYISQSTATSSASALTAFLRDAVDGEIGFGSCFDTGANTSTNCSHPPVPPGTEPPFPNLLAGAGGVAVSPDSRNVYVASDRADSILVLSAGGAFRGCFSSRELAGCQTLPDRRLDGAIGVAVSPDGRSVYVTSHEAHSISHFRRALDGSITPAGCVANGDSGLPACGAVASLGGADGVAVSPDSESVYVAGHSPHAITTFARGSLGELAFDGCQGATGAGGCVPGAPLIGARGVAVSPDGQSVYVASTSPFSASIAHLVRAPGGQLAFESCLGDSTGSCDEVPGELLGGAGSVAVSPDGRTVYVASRDAHSLTQFSRSTTDAGQLAFRGCQAAGGDAPPCQSLASDALRSASDVAVSPDGKSVYAISGAIAHLSRGNPADPLTLAGVSNLQLDDLDDVVVSPDGRDVYVTSAGSDAIAHLVRAPGGQLTFDGCLANTAADGCTDLPGAPLDGARRVAISADGQDVYVAGERSAAVAHFARDTGNGRLELDSCRANDSDGPCTAVPSSPLTGATGVTVSPDGRDVYVTASGADAVVRFVRSTVSGRLTFGNCLADDAAQGCADVPATPLDGAAEVAMSPDGASVYVAARNTIARLDRSGLLGQLAFGACHANNAADGCTDLPGTPLDGLRGLAVSPDGASVYATAATMRAVSHFARAAADGRLEFSTCMSGEEVAECRPLPSLPLAGAAGLAVSPDGASVYVASSGLGTIARFTSQ